MIVTAALGLVLTFWSSIESLIGQYTKYKIDAAINDQLRTHFGRLEFARYDDKETADLFDKAERFARFFRGCSTTLRQ